MTGGMISALSDYPEQVIARQLGSNERILWSGKPRQGLFIRRGDYGIMSFGLFLLAFSLCWECAVIYERAPAIMIIGGLWFVGMGAYWSFGYFWLRARRRKNTFYGVTDRRIVIVSGASWDELQSLELRNLPHLSLVEGQHRQGTIYFGDHSNWDPDGMPWPLGKGPPFLQFEVIENARQVFEIVRTAQAQAHSPAA